MRELIHRCRFARTAVVRAGTICTRSGSGQQGRLDGASMKAGLAQVPFRRPVLADPVAIISRRRLRRSRLSPSRRPEGCEWLS